MSDNKSCSYCGHPGGCHFSSDCGWNAIITTARARIKELEAQLAEARANALEWVTYDGTTDTLPELEQPVLVCLKKFDSIIENWSKAGKRAAYAMRRLTYDVTMESELCWDCSNPNLHSTDSTFIQVGDRWAYLPTLEED